MKKPLIYILCALSVCCSCIVNVKSDKKEVGEADKCRESIIERGFEIGLTVAERYLFYGHLDSVIDETSVILSSLRVMDCQSSEDLSGLIMCTRVEGKHICLFDKGDITVRDSVITIDYYGVLPYGPSWELEYVPVYKETLSFIGDTLISLKKASLLSRRDVTRKEYESVTKEYYKLKSADDIGHMDTDSVAIVFLKLFICSLNGNQEARELFLKIEENIPGSTDGLLAEAYYPWVWYLHFFGTDSLR